MKHSAAGADTDLVDVGSLPEALGELVFRRRAGVDATIAGHFVDLNGRIVSPDGGATWTYTGTVGSTPQKLATILSVTLPETAIGFRCKVTSNDIITVALNPSDFNVGDVIPAALITDMGSNPERYRVTPADPDATVIFGRA